MEKTTWETRRRRLSQIIEVGMVEDAPSRFYDFVNLLSIVVNLTVSVMLTFEGLRTQFGPVLLTLESGTVTFFAVDYVLRLWTAKYLWPKLPPIKALLRYLFSFSGLVDLLSFLPYYLPVFFPTGAAAFRMFRVMRFFRLFRINAYYDALRVITEVIGSRWQQIVSSVFIILILMLASSLVMYSLEHEAQPEVFSNAFSGIWWAASTLLTVGYGDIYPITTAGKAFGIVSAFLGVGMVAIPTGIISAGFVDQYSRIKRISEYAREEEVHFIKVQLSPGDSWAGKSIRELGLPHGVIVAVIQRGKEVLVPRGGVTLRPGDTLVLGAEPYGDDDSHIDLKELILRRHHPWNGQRVRELDISRKTVIVMVKRKGKILIPNGDLKLLEGDKVILYTQTAVSGAGNIEI